MTTDLGFRESTAVRTNMESFQRHNEEVHNVVGSFAKVADLLQEVLPIEDSVNSETIRNHLQATAERIEQELGEERPLNLFEGSEEDWGQQPLPDGPITVGLDGGYVRAAHKQGWFEVIAGKSVVAFQRNED